MWIAWRSVRFTCRILIFTETLLYLFVKYTFTYILAL